MKPALTAEEWAIMNRLKYLAIGGGDIQWGDDKHGHDPNDLRVFADGSRGASFVGSGRHALAALALYGQPFGFTREDATQLRALRIFIQTGVMPSLESRADIEDWLATHIDRIEALCPPEKPAA